MRSSIETVKANPIAFGLVATLAVAAIANRHLAKKRARKSSQGPFHYGQGGSAPLRRAGFGNAIGSSPRQRHDDPGLSVQRSIRLAAKKYRVIAFDRPGYGHGERPRSTSWTPEAQADLINTALTKMDISCAIVLGHSWGTLVAVALALKHPQSVQSLVLASGYYYPTVRADTLFLSAPSVPVFGDVLRHTISPIQSRLMWPLLLRKLFGPKPVPPKFKGFPKEMAVRPTQIRAGAAEAAL